MVMSGCFFTLPCISQCLIVGLAFISSLQVAASQDVSDVSPYQYAACVERDLLLARDVICVRQYIGALILLASCMFTSAWAYVWGRLLYKRSHKRRTQKDSSLLPSLHEAWPSPGPNSLSDVVSAINTNARYSFEEGSLLKDKARRDSKTSVSKSGSMQSLHLQMKKNSIGDPTMERYETLGPTRKTPTSDNEDQGFSVSPSILNFSTESQAQSYLQSHLQSQLPQYIGNALLRSQDTVATQVSTDAVHPADCLPGPGANQLNTTKAPRRGRRLMSTKRPDNGRRATEPHKLVRASTIAGDSPKTAASRMSIAEIDKTADISKFTMPSGPVPGIFDHPPLVTTFKHPSDEVMITTTSPQMRKSSLDNPLHIDESSANHLAFSYVNPATDSCANSINMSPCSTGSPLAAQGEEFFPVVGSTLRQRSATAVKEGHAFMPAPTLRHTASGRSLPQLDDPSNSIPENVTKSFKNPVFAVTGASMSPSSTTENCHPSPALSAKRLSCTVDDNPHGTANRRASKKLQSKAKMSITSEAGPSAVDLRRILSRAFGFSSVRPPEEDLTEEHLYSSIACVTTSANASNPKPSRKSLSASTGSQNQRRFSAPIAGTSQPSSPKTSSGLSTTDEGIAKGVLNPDNQAQAPPLDRPVAKISPTTATVVVNGSHGNRQAAYEDLELPPFTPRRRFSQLSARSSTVEVEQNYQVCDDPPKGAASGHLPKECSTLGMVENPLYDRS
ncbi:uncharacterized protein LOC135822475 [Sycon ciliatum]|uniref:uncharacterized protein LOC135822475 n=1 Tax=Sycon ciliatum TaxID=27933 RepID=UPI0031F6471E